MKSRFFSGKKLLFYTATCITTLNFGLCTLSSFAQFTFVHITDLHISDATSYVNSCDNNAVMFQCYIKEFANLNPKPAFVVASGDITNIGNSGPYGMYPMLTQYLFPGLVMNPGIGAYFIDSAHTIPIYFVPGNHDYYTSITPPTADSTLVYYPKYIAPDTDYAVTFDNAVIIFVRSGYDDDRPLWQDPNILSPESSGLSDAQCQWLRNVLNANSNKRKIIVMHHPPVNAAGTNSDGTPYTGTIWDTADGSILNNRTTFLNICDSNHVNIVLAGHRHQNVVAGRAGNVVSETWTDSTRYIQTGAAFDGSYRIITVSSSFVNVSTPMLSCSGSDVSELNNPISISVFPNPATNNLTIEAPQKSYIEISNIQGQLIKTLAANQLATCPDVIGGKQSGNKINVDISAFPCGVYFIKIKTEKGIAVKKFVKE